VVLKVASGFSRANQSYVGTLFSEVALTGWRTSHRLLFLYHY
jgi:hypothetical protein